MQAIPGRVVANMEVTKEFRANICVSVNQALADLHSVDYKAVGLDGSDLNPSGPCEYSNGLSPRSRLTQTVAATDTWVHTVFTAPHMRRRGVASRLYRHLETEARQAGAPQPPPPLPPAG